MAGCGATSILLPTVEDIVSSVLMSFMVLQMAAMVAATSQREAHPGRCGDDLSYLLLALSSQSSSELCDMPGVGDLWCGLS